MSVILNQCLARCQAGNTYREREQKERQERSVHLTLGTWHWWTGGPRGEGRGRLLVWGVGDRRMWARQEWCSGRCKCQTGKERERYARLCDSSYIESRVCVDKDSCISQRNKLFRLAQCSTSPSVRPSTLQWPKSKLASSHLYLPLLFSESPLHLSHSVAVASQCNSPFFLILSLLNSVVLYLHEWKENFIASRKKRYSGKCIAPLQLVPWVNTTDIQIQVKTKTPVQTALFLGYS